MTLQEKIEAAAKDWSENQYLEAYPHERGVANEAFTSGANWALRLGSEEGEVYSKPSTVNDEEAQDLIVRNQTEEGHYWPTKRNELIAIARMGMEYGRASSQAEIEKLKAEIHLMGEELGQATGFLSEIEDERDALVKSVGVLREALGKLIWGSRELSYLVPEKHCEGHVANAFEQALLDAEDALEKSPGGGV